VFLENLSLSLATIPTSGILPFGSDLEAWTINAVDGNSRCEPESSVVQTDCEMPVCEFLDLSSDDQTTCEKLE